MVCARALAILKEGASALDGEKHNQLILEANKFIVDSSFSGLENEDCHWADCSRAQRPCLCPGCGHRLYIIIYGAAAVIRTD